MTLKTNYPVFLFLLAFCPLWGTTFYLDPVNGSLANNGTITSPFPSFKEVINANLIVSFRYNNLPYNPPTSQLVIKNSGAPIQGGDTLILMEGKHGSIELDQYFNQKWITVLAAKDATVQIANLHIRAGSKWRFEGLEISSEPYGNYYPGSLVYMESHGHRGPVHDIDIRNCFVYSALDISTWKESDWLSNVSSGMNLKGSKMWIEGNVIRNIDMGISLVGDSMLALNNQVINFSGDGMRALGANQLIEGNLIKNC